MATTVSHSSPTAQAQAIADLTGYEDAATLRWQQACVQAANQLTALPNGRYVNVRMERMRQGLELAQRGAVTLPENGEGSVTKRLLYSPVPCPSACKTRGEVACGARVAIKRQRQSKAWQAGAERWTSLDMGERGGLGAQVCLLPPPRGQTDWHSLQPMPCQDAYL